MKTTKKVTVSAMVIALGAIFLTLGSAFEVLDLSLAAIASLLVVFVFIELGSPYVWLVWLSTALISFIFFSGSVVWIEYLLVFGLYPILKAYIERAPKIFWLVLKLVYINAVIVALIYLVKWILGVPFFGEELWYINAGLYVLMNVAFIAYDMFINVMLRLYFCKYRKIFKKFLK